MGLYADRIFPALLDLATRGVYRDREALMARARGRILEIGLGSGINLPLYTAQAHEVIGLEPSRAMLERARRLLADQPAKPDVSLVQGSAEELPFADNSFDTVVAFLVFCTIPDARRAALEMHRVLRAGGEVLFFEHIRAPDAGVQRWQDRLDPLWTKMACGCHINRETPQLFRDAGLNYREYETWYHPKMGARISSRVMRGVAQKSPA